MTRFTSLILAAACVATLVGMPTPGEAHQSRFDNHYGRSYHHQPRPRFYRDYGRFYHRQPRRQLDPQLALLRMFFQGFAQQQFPGRQFAAERRHDRGGDRNRDRRRQHR